MLTIYRKRLSTIFNLSVDNLADVLTEEHLINRQPIIKDYWFDNKAERIFYYEIMPEIFAGDYAQWVTPQAELSSLIPNLGINGKVDFLICHPSSSKPIVVEIDEQQHQSSKKSNQKRDEALTRFGYYVLRFPVKRVEKNAGQIIDTICSKLDYERKDRIEDKHSLVIKAIKISHQIQLTLLQAIKYGFKLYDLRSMGNCFRYPTEWLFDK